jgi:hypothetical protein
MTREEVEEQLTKLTGDEWPSQEAEFKIVEKKG